MRAAETAAELERRIVSRLLPLDAEVGNAGAASDYDLNPGLPRDGRALVDAAVLVALVLRPAGPAVILTLRTDTLTKHAGQVAFPGGRCDPGETAVETALREAQEEVGLDPAFVRPLALAPRYVTGTGYRIAPVVAFVREGFSLEPSPAEVAEVFETPWAWLMDGANVGLDSRDLGGVGAAVPQLQLGGPRDLGCDRGHAPGAAAAAVRRGAGRRGALPPRPSR